MGRAVPERRQTRRPCWHSYAMNHSQLCHCLKVDLCPHPRSSPPPTPGRQGGAPDLQLPWHRHPPGAHLRRVCHDEPGIRRAQRAAGQPQGPGAHSLAVMPKTGLTCNLIALQLPAQHADAAPTHSSAHENTIGPHPPFALPGAAAARVHDGAGLCAHRRDHNVRRGVQRRQGARAQDGRRHGPGEAAAVEAGPLRLRWAGLLNSVCKRQYASSCTSIIIRAHTRARTHTHTHCHARPAVFCDPHRPRRGRPQTRRPRGARGGRLVPVGALHWPADKCGLQKHHVPAS